mmetsp:Transcript_103652/g.200854  ORF Transcript_103652/g.200854 Transcript_103652/m.200854 type:complete len:84 (+) Transcript_103652:1038-1289(+)
MKLSVWLLHQMHLRPKQLQRTQLEVLMFQWQPPWAELVSDMLCSHHGKWGVGHECTFQYSQVQLSRPEGAVVNTALAVVVLPR